MQRYGVLATVVAIFLFLYFLLLQFKTPEQKKSSVPGETENLNIQNSEPEVSLSDYFEKQFVDSKENTADREDEPDFKTCDLLGQSVKEGTSIFDSTCATE